MESPTFKKFNAALDTVLEAAEDVDLTELNIGACPAPRSPSPLTLFPSSVRHLPTSGDGLEMSGTSGDGLEVSGTSGDGLEVSGTSGDGLEVSVTSGVVDDDIGGGSDAIVPRYLLSELVNEAAKLKAMGVMNEVRALLHLIGQSVNCVCVVSC